jgi:catechol 2,3-dioxygenase-like lactoylglutathione lyase family enzyme
MPAAQRTATVRELVPLLFVEDIDRSVGFYRDRLGFEVAGTWEPGGKLVWCRIQRGRSAVMLQQADEEDGPAAGRGRGIGFFFVCDSVHDIYAEFSDRGLHLDPPQTAFYGMEQVFVKDPDAYELCFESAQNQ